MKYEHYAARFAAKEAAIKAIGALGNTLPPLFREIEVCRHPSGKPYLSIGRRARKCLGLAGKFQMELSLAHEREFAVAAVMLSLK